MEFVKLKTGYYRDVALLRAGEAAELLFLRSLAYAGEQETDGFIPSQALPQLVSSRGKARAAALVREGLWEVAPDGWIIAGWDRHQVTTADLDHKRQKTRARVQKHRAKARNSVTNSVTNASVTPLEVEVEVEDAAAAASATPPQPLPPAVEILRSRLDAAKLTVRWDRLDANQLATIEHLVDVHGDAALVRAALVSHRPDAPAAFAQAWLAGWQAMPEPGTGLRVVDDQPCPESGHSGTVRHCTACASERIAVDR